MNFELREFLYNAVLVSTLFIILIVCSFVYKSNNATPNYTEEYLIKMEKQIEDIERTVNRLEILLNEE